MDDGITVHVTMHIEIFFSWMWQDCIICIFSINVELYKVLVKELAQTLERQFTSNAESRAAGMVINTMGWVEGVGYEVSFFNSWDSSCPFDNYCWFPSVLPPVIYYKGTFLLYFFCEVASSCYRDVQGWCSSGIGSGKTLFIFCGIQCLLYSAIIADEFSQKRHPFPTF